MNTCHFSKELSSYLDSQLPEEQKRKVEEHLKECKVCAQELAHLKAVSAKLKEWRAPDLGPFFVDTVKERIASPGPERGEVKMKKKLWYVVVPSGVVAGILLFLFVGISMNLYLKRGYQGRMRIASNELLNERAKVTQRAVTYSGAEQDYKKVAYDWSAGGRAGNVESAEGYVSSQLEPYYHQTGDVTRSMSFDASVSLEKAGRENLAAGGGLYAPSEGTVIVIQPSIPATSEGDKVIRTAEVRLEVEDGKAAYNKASEICQELGGYLASSNFYKDNEERESGTITMRIPKDKFLIALEKLSALGKLENTSSNSQDVGQEYANLKAQLEAAMVVYNKTLEALNKRQTTIPEAMRLESELTPVLQRVQDLKNKIEYLNNMVSFTTITVYFHEPNVSAKVLTAAKERIKESVLATKINAVNFLVKTLPNLVGMIAVVTIIGVGLLAIALLVKHLIARLFKRG